MKENYNLEQQNDRKYIWNQKFQKQLIRKDQVSQLGSLSRQIL